MLRPIALAGFVVLMPTIVEAQGRVMMPTASHPVAAAPRVVAHAPQTVVTQPMSAGASVIRVPATRSSNPGRVIRMIARSSNPAPESTADSMDFTGDFIPVPGLGFDIPHLAATRGPGSVGAGIHRRQVAAFFPFFAGGFFQPVSPVVVVVEPPASPEQPPERTAAEVSEPERRPQASEPAPVSPTEVAPTPQPEEEQFVFVRRDGKLLFGVAYAWENGTLRYVTGEGFRRSVSKDALDLDATQQLNEQRGLIFHFPARADS